MSVIVPIGNWVLPAVTGFADMLTQEQVKEIAKGVKGAADEAVEDDQLFQALFEYFLSTGEMPYGVAKARTGDPYLWIAERLESMA